jgi:hypothetical protein
MNSLPITAGFMRETTKARRQTATTASNADSIQSEVARRRAPEYMTNARRAKTQIFNGLRDGRRPPSSFQNVEAMIPHFD